MSPQDLGQVAHSLGKHRSRHVHKVAFGVFPGAFNVICMNFFEFSGVTISVCPFEGAFMGYREMLVYQRIHSGIGTPTIAENLGTSSNVLLNNIRFPEITGEDNLTMFSYSGRVKSAKWRWQRRRADLRHFESFRHGPIVIYTRLPAGGNLLSDLHVPREQ